MKKNKNLIILILVLSVLSALPLFATAQDTGYVPLAPIPGVTPENEPVVLANYLSGAFALAIGITGVLAVLVIMIGGIQYITSGSFSGKEDGKEKISKALIGLFLAIAAWIILYTINPDLLSLKLNITKTENGQQEEPLPPPPPLEEPIVGGVNDVLKDIGDPPGSYRIFGIQTELIITEDYENWWSLIKTTSKRCGGNRTSFGPFEDRFESSMECRDKIKDNQWPIHALPDECIAYTCERVPD